ncbi:phytoene synthase [Corynebacterium sp. 13CS0277]|uniref:phytoene/squalene synthase family protein n=1 Tax=Corynebacterium sp. 13CS0277 TaxID=2071994 RepID=UPI000D042955|nr:phytoene/squalene synthase family protein [Corynebacterium sp. 13CS0277]PRQ10871.1 phytoene synthase [Corynebacterium sp. 13CS0277]
MDHSPATSHPEEPLVTYTRMAVKSAHPIIGEYSTSFSLATRLLDRSTRSDIANLYAMVRIADEIVDGTAHAAGLDNTRVAEILDTFERDTFTAIEEGFSPNPVLHAFADTARRTHIDGEHIRAFFRSMRRDVVDTDYDAAALDDYIYGSAEVIGLMCLSIFTAAAPLDAHAHERATYGARQLGAAFQKINFLRDLAEDAHDLGRAYVPGARGSFHEADKQDFVAQIDANLAEAYATIGYLPYPCRVGVLTAFNLFEALTRAIEATPAATLKTTRISVGPVTKARLAATSAIAARTLAPEAQLRR